MSKWIPYMCNVSTERNILKFKIPHNFYSLNDIKRKYVLQGLASTHQNMPKTKFGNVKSAENKKPSKNGTYIIMLWVFFSF